ncbi:hypothetical protein [Ideonella sp. B508-1]|uniref:hypothetical protein n=1 Tax=Ideonella sp. B508-1 TaxID=137716 RepID=UPI00034862A3|nr:hypothetical protein [Ideonella sp. B508-1]
MPRASTFAFPGLLIAALSAAMLSACGGGTGSSVSALTQTVTISAPTGGTAGASASLSASASSGLTSFSYASSTPAVCTVSGSTVTYVSAGSCSVTAYQAGNAAYAPATSNAAQITVAAAPVVAPTLVFSSGFNSGNLTVEGGAYGAYGGSNLDGYACSWDPAWCGAGGSSASSVGADASSYYFYYQTPSPATGQYAGIYIQAPGLTTGLSTTGDTSGVQLSGQTKISFNLGQNPEWFSSGTNNFGVLLTLGKLYTVNGGACNLKLVAIVTPTAAANTQYTLPLSSFVVTQDCGTGINTAAAALAVAPVSQVDFQGDGGAAALTAGGASTGANSTVAVNGVYPTTIALQGGIRFLP